jgi:dihydroorotase
VLHISSADELRPLAEAKARGVDVTGETCPHYLLFDERAYTNLGSFIRVNPPVARSITRRALGGAHERRHRHDRHRPRAARPRREGRENIWTADCGFPGVETQMPLMLTQAAAGRISLQDYVRLSATAPAKAFGLYPKKGLIAPGADADIALVDLKREETITAAGLHSRAKITPFEGMVVRGVPVHTLVRGRFVMRDRTLVPDTKGWGRSVRRIQAMPAPQPRNVDQTLAAVTAPVGLEPASDSRTRSFGQAAE